MKASTYDDSCDSLFRVATPLQVLRNNGENTGRQSHVEQPVSLGTTLLQLCQVLIQVLKRLVLVVLAGNICAETQEMLKLLLNLLCRGLDVRLDALQIFFMIHLSTSIPNDFDILGQKLVSELLHSQDYELMNGCSDLETIDAAMAISVAHQSKKRRVLHQREAC